jgi:hypothetical protein
MIDCHRFLRIVLNHKRHGQLAALDEPRGGRHIHLGPKAFQKSNKARDDRHGFGACRAVLREEHIAPAAVNELQNDGFDDVVFISLGDILVVVKGRGHNHDHREITARLIIQRLDDPMDHNLPVELCVGLEAAALFNDSRRYKVNEFICACVRVLNVVKSSLMSGAAK